MFLGFPFLFLVFAFFELHCACFVLAFLAFSCVAIQECLAFYSCASCFYLLAIVYTFPPNNVFDTRLIFNDSFRPISCCLLAT